MNIDNELKPFVSYEQGPATEPQLKSSGHGRAVRVMEWTGNPVGYVEYGGQMLPYPSIYTGNRNEPAEHATLMELQDLDPSGVTFLPPEDQRGDPAGYRVGSGAQFGQPNVSLLGQISRDQAAALQSLPPAEVERIYRGRAASAPSQGPGTVETAGQRAGVVSSQDQEALPRATILPIAATPAAAKPAKRTEPRRRGWGVRK